MIAPDHAFLGALRALREALRHAGARAMVIGGLAVIARGVPRLTGER